MSSSSTLLLFNTGWGLECFSAAFRLCNSRRSRITCFDDRNNGAWHDEIMPSIQSRIYLFVEGVEERRVLHLFAVQWGEFVNPIDPQPRFTDGTFLKDVRHSDWQDENWLTKCKPIWFFHLPIKTHPSRFCAYVLVSSSLNVFLPMEVSGFEHHKQFDNVIISWLIRLIHLPNRS